MSSSNGPRRVMLAGLLLGWSGWLAAMTMATVVRRAPPRWPSSVVAAAGVVYVTGSLVCHQRPERTLQVRTVPLPVCARCTGLYVGALAGLLFGIWGARRASPGHRVLLVAAALPTLVSLGLEWAGGPSPLWSRVITAGPLGAAVAIVVAETLRGRGRGEAVLVP